MARRPSAGSISLVTSIEPRQNGLSPATSKRHPPLPLDTSRRPSVRSASTFQKLDTSANVGDLDPDDLFAKHSVAEVRMIQQRLRADADAKQEELRLMVGERYRDLLEASTSILGLAKSSKHVLEALEEMRETVNAITPVRAPKRAATGEDKHLQALQSLSAHVKLLLDAPEHLWRLMEKRSYLNAAWLFLLARVVYRALSQEDDDQSWHSYGVDVMEQMPLVQRQWDTITPFRSQISHRATLSLREASNTPGEVCATLLTLHLLESRPLPETLTIYLAQRTKMLSGLLTRNASTSANGSATDAKPNGRVSNRPRKVVLRETKQKAEALLDAISRTVSTARTVFADYGSTSPSLMKQALQFFQAPSDNPESLPPELQLTTQIILTTLPSSSHLLLLPQSIRTYKPYIDSATALTPALQPQLRDKLEGWFKKMIKDAREALADWFASLETIGEVWDVRGSLLTWLSGTQGLESPERQELKSIINLASQNQATSVWKSALGLLEVSFRDAVTSAMRALEQEAADHKFDTQPVEHLFLAPSIPLSQTAAQSSAAAAQFSKYKSALRQQLSGRTPLLESTLATLERHASDIQKDVAAMAKSSEPSSEQVVHMLSAYRTDAEAICERICDVLEGTNEKDSSRNSVFIARICQELISSSDFFTRVGCSPTTTDVLRDRVHTLYVTLTETWQERTVARIVEVNFSEQPLGHNIRHSSDDSTAPSRPSHALAQALLSLSFELQQLGVCLEGDRRRLQVASALRRFVVAYLARLERNAPESIDIQTLWDLAFLQKLTQLWGKDTSDTSDRLAASITARRDAWAGAKVPPQPDLAASALGYLSRTQILFAGLLPFETRRNPGKAEPMVNAEKPSNLLVYGTPAVETKFEPALELVKPPQRFGLLLVGGVAVR
ncbi:hypothetical protein BD311DRAFT_802305 [Dichomitus squalens]|uniref:Conserved oligomeric Golgi complex subunit 1 n=1 Tax=Dichomitus squalens TaxID=114155 RepID=A0A4Q9N2H2_9APHY|nr:hypothetical protein BD311DRAFT_802305 [Dichomitus squalens]